ncbi:unnamed protein product, partial [Prunus brigantina]
MCSMRLSPWCKWKGPKKLRWPKKFQRKGMPNLALWCPKRRKICPRRVPVNKVFVDIGATVHILLTSIMRKLKKDSNELIPIEITVSGFVGDTTTSKGIIPLQVRVGQKVRMTTFFVVETTAHFNALLGRDWIHGSMCVPSSLHQFLQFWHDDGSVEIV